MENKTYFKMIEKDFSNLFKDIKRTNQIISNINTQFEKIQLKLLKKKKIKFQSINSIKEISKISSQLGLKIKSISHSRKISKIFSKIISRQTSKDGVIFDNNKIYRTGSNRLISSDALEITKKINICKFKNVYDSFDSSGEEKDYNYYDYVPKLFSITENSIFYFSWKILRQFAFYILLFIYPIFLIQQNNDLKENLFISIVIYFIYVLLTLNIFIEYVFLAYDDVLLGKTNFSYLKIFNNNLNTKALSLLLDLASCSSIFYFKDEIFIKLLLKLFLIKYMLKWVSLKRIFKIKDYLSNEQIKLRNLHKIIFLFVMKNPLIKVVLFFSLIIHIFSCIWIFIGIKSFNSIEMSWIKVFDHDINNYLQLYTTSVYFIITTLLTVGYGDILPCNLNERIYVIIMLFSGGLIYSFILTIISSMFINKNKRLALYRERLSTLVDINDTYKLNQKLYHNTYQAINHYYKHWKEDKEDFISTLPSSLKITLQFKMYENLIMKVKFLKKLTDNINNQFNEIEIKGFLTTLIPKLSYQIYKQRDIILDIGDTVEEMYFISSGSIRLTVSYDNENIKLLKIYNGSHFGDILMNTYIQSPLAIRCNSKSCNLMVLKKLDFIDIKSKYDSIVISLIESSMKINNYLTTKLNESDNYFKKYGNLNDFEHYFKTYNKNNIGFFSSNEKKESMDNAIQKKGSMIKKILSKVIIKKVIFRRDYKRFEENPICFKDNNSRGFSCSKVFSEDSVNLTSNYTKNDSFDKNNSQVYYNLKHNVTKISDYNQSSFNKNYQNDIHQSNELTYDKLNGFNNETLKVSTIRMFYDNRILTIINNKIKSNNKKRNITSLNSPFVRQCNNKSNVINEININVRKITQISNNTDIINRERELSSFIKSGKSNNSKKTNVTRENVKTAKSVSPFKFIPKSRNFK